MLVLTEGKPPKLVMFDLDGTLIDSVPDIAVAVDRMLESIGRSAVGEDKVRNWVGNGSAALVARALLNRLIPSESIDQTLDDLQTNQAELWQKSVAGFQHFYSTACAEHTRIYPGVIEFLDYLAEHQVPMAILTNKPTLFTGPILQALKLDHYFGEVVCGDTCERKKPEPDQLHFLLEKYGTKAEQALMIGDSINDVLAARNANVPVIAVSYGYNYDGPIANSNPDLTVDSLAELI
ncbi:MAG: phosphoglycolate phosphatase [Pseudomonadales bacterium]|nr:phosphoglycolate phosphatase [Pseudomonadales bacterium]